jgi:hypothetical protein
LRRIVGYFPFRSWKTTGAFDLGKNSIPGGGEHGGLLLIIGGFLDCGLNQTGTGSSNRRIRQAGTPGECS